MGVFGSSTWPSTRRLPSPMVALEIVNPETADGTDAGIISAAEPTTRISAAEPPTRISDRGDRGVVHLDESNDCVIVRAPCVGRAMPFVGLSQRHSIAP